MLGSQTKTCVASKLGGQAAHEALGSGGLACRLGCRQLPLEAVRRPGR